MVGRFAGASWHIVESQAVKVAVMSDVHGNLPALASAMAYLSPWADHILFLGDVAGYYPFVHECLDLLRDRRVVAVRGNHDDLLLRHLRGAEVRDAYRRKYGSALERSAAALTADDVALLESWPPRLELELAGLSLLLVHGAPWDPLGGRVYPDFGEWQRFDECSHDVVLMGHTHYALIRRDGDRLVLNPGSVGQARDEQRGACLAELELPACTATVTRTAYDPAPVREDSLRNDPDVPYLVDVLERG